MARYRTRIWGDWHRAAGSDGRQARPSWRHHCGVHDSSWGQHSQSQIFTLLKISLRRSNVILPTVRPENRVRRAGTRWRKRSRAWKTWWPRWRSCRLSAACYKTKKKKTNFKPAERWMDKSQQQRRRTFSMWCLLHSTHSLALRCRYFLMDHGSLGCFSWSSLWKSEYFY